MLNLLYVKLSAIITISLFLVVAIPPLMPLIKLPSSVTCNSVISKLNSSAEAKQRLFKLNINVKNMIINLFFIKFNYRDEINY